MKKILVISFILLSLKSSGQKLDAKELQEQWFMKAEKLLKRDKPFKALQQYDFAHRIGPVTEYKIKAKIKIDSLLPILQITEMKKWIGVWKLKQLRTNMFNFEKIIITDNEILFFDKENDSLPSRNENINIAEYSKSEYVSLSRVVFKNREIWEFNVENYKREDRLFVNLKTDAEGKTYVYNGHSGWIIDRKERKKAMSEETRTYYIRKK